MSTPLSGIPVERRQRLAATLGLFVALFVAIATVSLTGRDSAAAPIFAGVSIAVAVFLALVAWGVLRSIRLDRDSAVEAELDAAIEATVQAHGGQMCDCGHEHDPGELHITDACEHDGSGSACSHDCATCVLTALRPSPAVASRPSPRPHAERSVS